MNQEQTLNDDEIRDMLQAAIPEEARITPLKGFKMGFNANPGFRRFFFAARCSCSTAALLSVEVAKDKTASQIREALPSLIEGLKRQARLFYNMPCEAHKRMQMYPGLQKQP